MQIPKFKEFFVEQDLERKQKPISVAIITIADSDDPKENTTADLISKACKKKGIECVIVNTKTTIITDKDEDKNTLTVYNYDGDGAKHTFVGKDTICMVRGGALQDEGGLSLISAFQNSQAFMINTRAAMLTCDNKLTTAILFEKCGIPCNIIFSCLFSNYKSSTEEDHGQVLCWASNGLGEQIQPCVFRVVPLASPAPPKDCRVIPNTFFTLSAEFSKDAFFSTLLVFLSTLLTQ